MLNTILDTVRNHSGKIAVGLGGLTAYRYRKSLKRGARSMRDYVMGEDDDKSDKKERKELAKEIVRQERRALKKLMAKKREDAKKEAKKTAKKAAKAEKKAAKAEKKAAKKAAKSGQVVAAPAPAHTPFGDAVIEALKAELAASKAREETIRAEAKALVDDAMAQMREASAPTHVVPRKRAVKKVAAVK